MANSKRSSRRGDREGDLDREIAFHIDELTAANIANGMAPEEARRSAILEFGGREQVAQELREVHTSRLFESAAFNLKAALRFLRRSPSFSTAVILTLALGIGANSAVFSAIDAVVLRPLPFPESNQLLVLYQLDSRSRDANRLLAPIRLEEWNRMNATFQAITGYDRDELSETSLALPERVTEAVVAPRFLEVMGASPTLGRDFTQEEERFGGPDAVLISNRFWQRRFHGDPAALGKKLHIGNSSDTIVGIMPAAFIFPDKDVDLWAPSPPDAPYAQNRQATWFTAVGRMKPGVTQAHALADLSAVQARLGKQFPKPDADLVVEATPLKEKVVSGIRESLWLLYVSVSILLLIACSNIAALLLARTSDRAHEISVRFSLGASRRAIISQLLTEVLVLALIGSGLGLLLAAGAAHVFQQMANTLPRAGEIVLNWRIVFYTFVCALATTLICGLVPALRGTRLELAQSLAQNSRTQASSRHPLQWLLVGVQVMLAVTLLSGAGLLLRSLQQLSRVSPGFDPGQVLKFQITGSWGETADMKTLAHRIDRTLDGLRGTPGVEAAAIAELVPGIPEKYQMEFSIDGRSNLEHKVLAESRPVSSGYFDTMRIPLFQGEPCREQSATSDVVVNRSFVRMYMNDSPVLGHNLAIVAERSLPIQGIVRGVVGDAREEGLNTPPVPTVYLCFSAPSPFPNYLVRTHGGPMAMAETIRRRVKELEPQRSVFAMMPLQQQLEDAYSENRLRTVLLGSFAMTAVLLASIGLYGTLNYLGRLRRREMGVRLALGAVRSNIVGHFLNLGLRVTVVGSIAGVLLSLGTNRLLTHMLYGVSTLDGETYLAVLSLILMVAIIASLLPAWRAAHVDPIAVLRQE
jgi:putative ABC transport system permease protein